jgi:hypothetical protein
MHDRHNIGRRRIRPLAAISVVLTAFAGAGSVTSSVVTAPAATAATYVGSAARLVLRSPIVAMATTPTGRGYWLAARDGGIFAFGDARYRGAMGGRRLTKPIVGMAATPTGQGYWLAAADGGIFAFGDARFKGSAGAWRLNRPVVGMGATKSGNGYWLVAADGGIFAFGDARFKGSTGALRLRKPIVGMAPTATSNGYWLVASDGGLFTFGDARFYGSAANRRLLDPIVGMAAAPGSGGYWLAAADGAIFSFGGARFYGSAAGALAGQRAVGVDASPTNDGYWVASQWGGVDTASPSGMRMDPNLVPRRGEDAIALELVQRINAERTTRGLHALYVDPYLRDVAVGWAGYLAVTNRFEHNNLATIIQKAGGRFGVISENVFKGAGNGATDAGTAHVALMGSDGHRSNILLPEQRDIGVGAGCHQGTLVVVEDFGVPAGAPVSPHAVPPRDPVAAANEGGSSC